MEVAQDILFSAMRLGFRSSKTSREGGWIQIKQSKTGRFGKGTVSIEGRELFIRGKMRWDMWLRLFDYVVMAAVLLLVVWVPVILVLKLAGPPLSLPPDASAGDALVAWGRDGTR